MWLKSKRVMTCAVAAAAVGAWSCGVLAQQGPSGNSDGTSHQNTPQNQNNSAPNQNRAWQQGQSGATGQQAPEGFVMIREDVVYMMANEPQNHFVRALADLSQKDPQKAAGELSVAASYIDDISSRGNAGSKSALEQCASTLRQLAGQIRAGQIRDAKQLGQDFARVSLALANHFQKSADSDISGNHDVKAGYDLRAAAMSYRDALDWSNQTPDQQQVHAIDDARRTAAAFLQAAPQGEENSWAESENGNQNASAAGNRNAHVGQNRENQNMAGNPPSAQQASQQLAAQIQQTQAQVAQKGNTPGGSPVNNGSTAGER